MPHDVFVSYSSKGAAVAEAVCRALEQNGVHCWIAPRDIVSGDDWATSIVRGIDANRMMVLIFSRNAQQSQFVKREVDLAASRNMPIVPVRIEDVAPAGGLEFYLNSSHWMNAIAPPFDQHLQRLSTDVRRLLGITRERPPVAARGDEPSRDRPAPADVGHHGPDGSN